MNISFNINSFTKATNKGYCPNVVILLLFLESKERKMEEITTFLGMSDRALYRYLKTLKTEGYIKVRTESVFTYYNVTDKIDELWT